MDMVGRFDEAHKDDDRYVYLIGSDKLSTELHDISEAVNEGHIGNRVGLHLQCAR